MNSPNNLKQPIIPIVDVNAYINALNEPALVFEDPIARGERLAKLLEIKFGDGYDAELLRRAFEDAECLDEAAVGFLAFLKHKKNQSDLNRPVLPSGDNTIPKHVMEVSQEARDKVAKSFQIADAKAVIKSLIYHAGDIDYESKFKGIELDILEEVIDQIADDMANDEKLKILYSTVISKVREYITRMRNMPEVVGPAIGQSVVWRDMDGVIRQLNEPLTPDS